MAKSKEELSGKTKEDKLVSARCHCPVCGKTYVCEILMSNEPKETNKSMTPCRKCKEGPEEKTVFLIFDRKY